MTKTYAPGEPIGALRPGCVLDYTGIVVRVLEGGGRLVARFRDGETATVSTHPDFTFSMRRAYSHAAKFVAESDARGGIEPTEENFAQLTAGCGRRPDLFDSKRALWVLRHDPEGARLGRPVISAEDGTEGAP